MELQDSILKEFSDAINKTDDSGEKTRSVYGTVVKDDSGLYVRFDGSEINTPATSTVEVGNGDRVLAIIKGHNAIITGNVSWPSLTRMGPIALTLTSEGLVIVALNDDNEAFGHHILITNNSVEVIDPAGGIVAKFGTTAQIGRSDSVHAVTTSTGLKILDNRENVIARFEDTVQIGRNGKPHTNITGSRFEVYNANNELVGYFGDSARIGKADKAHMDFTGTGMSLSEGTKNLANFTSDLISLAQGLVQISSNLIKLGNSNDAMISLCNRKGSIAYEKNALGLNGDDITTKVGVNNYKPPYLVSCATNANTPASDGTPIYASSLQVVHKDGSKWVADASVVADKDNGVHVTVPTNKMLRVNGNEVLVANRVYRNGTITRTVSTIASSASITVYMDVTIPKGYNMVGLSQLSSSNGGVLPFGWGFDGNRIWVTITNLNGSSASNVTIRATWFAIRAVNEFEYNGKITYLATLYTN